MANSMLEGRVGNCETKPRKPRAQLSSSGRLLSSRLAVILWCALGELACTNGDCTSPSPEAEPGRFLKWAQAELDRPGDIEDLVVGDGRLAQNDRRMELSATVSSPDGKVLAEGPLRVEWPRWKARVDAVVPVRSTYDKRLFGGVAGMRVGGERQFSLRFRRDHRDECQDSKGHCNFWMGGHVNEVPYDGSLVFRVKLLSVCAPRYCERTTYSIPIDSSHELIERSCR